ncbi:MAG: NAD(P)/FAD-dependent oxidoreductase [Promethearchaeota archaeon]
MSGGGFGGFYLALELEKKKHFKTILIDPTDFFVYTPLIHEVSIGEIPESAVKINYKSVLKHTIVIKSKVKYIEFTNNQVITDDDTKIKYNYLIICPGSRAANIIKGSEDSFFFHNLNDAIKIKKTLIGGLTEKKANISIVGEGLTGIELTGQLATYFKKIKKDITLHHFLYFPKYLMNNPGFDDIIKIRMRKLNVNVHPEERALEIDNDVVRTYKNTYQSSLIFTCTGIQPNMIDSDVKFENGYEVNEYCQLKNFDNVYVIGDAAKFIYQNNPAPALAQIAIKEAKYVAKDILRRIKSAKRKKFKPKILGMLITIGKYYAIGEFLGKYRIKGAPTWFIKRFYYFLEIFKITKDWRLLLILIKSSLFVNYYLYEK